jgi:hypothetical protein
MIGLRICFVYDCGSASRSDGGSPAGNQLKQKGYHSQNQQQMNKSAHGVAAHNSQKPQN